jgi:uncharacterized membrane protein YedE/YeeE
MDMIIAMLIGVAFGWFLERGGMGDAQKLAAQFYLKDFTVIKVMFSALITAMLGLFWLGRAGAIDITRVYVPETFLLSQALGGAIFGAGFVIGGLCPGTSCVAAASGRVDGLFVMFGMLGGALLSGFALPVFEQLYYATSRGSATLPATLRVTYGTVAGAIAVGGVLMFAAIHRLEASRGAA